MEKLLWLLIPAVVGVGAFMAGISRQEDKGHPYDEAQDVALRDEEAGTDDDDADEAEDLPPTELVRAEIKRVKRDMNPVTLSSWTRIVCACADGVERTMSFDGESGMFLSEGDTGVLEHREGVFVSFEKDSGEVVAPMYHIPAEEE